MVSFSAIDVLPRVVAAPLLRRVGDQPLDQLLLASVGLLVVDLAGLPEGLDVGQGRLDGGRVRPLPVSLLLHLLGHPRHPAHRREREEEQLADQYHDSSPVRMGSRKEYGGCGPTYLIRIRCSVSWRRAPTASSNIGQTSRSTRKAACSTSCAPAASFSATARLSGASRSSTVCRSSSSSSSRAEATACPSSTCR